MMIEQGRTSNSIIYAVTRKKNNSKLLWGMAWVFSTIIFAAIQLLLGADEKMVAMAFVSLLCCAIPLFLFGINDISAVFIFVLLTKYSFFPLWIKTLLGERIDIGLTSPFNTFAIALAGSIIGCIALIFAKIIPIKRRILGYSLSSSQMLMAGYLATGFGMLFLALHAIFGPVLLPSGEFVRGFGGFGTLIGPLYFGIVCLAATAMKPKANPIHKIFLLIIFLLIMLVSLRSNAKVYFTFSVFSFVLAIFYFDIRIKIHHLIYLSIFIAFYIFVFAPVIFITRTADFKLANLSGKISVIENLYKNYSILDIHDQSKKILGEGNYYSSTGIALVDRFEMIEDLDIPAGGMDRENTIGWTAFRLAVETSLPSFIIPNKPKISDIDLIVYNAGYYPVLTTLNHTIGVFGSTYAMFLWPSLFFVSLAILILYLFMIRIIVLPDLRYNPFGIFFLAYYVFNFSEQSVQALLMTMLRGLPTDVILILGILYLTVFMNSNTRKRVLAPSRKRSLRA